MRRNDLNETVYPEALADQPLQAMDKFSLSGRIPLTPLHEHDRHFNPIRVCYRKRARLARSHLGQFLSEMLQILSPDFSAIDNDDIFFPANDHNPTFGEPSPFDASTLIAKIETVASQANPLPYSSLDDKTFFGVRGVGSLYYLAYATSEADFGDHGQLWAVVAFTITLSVVVHGITATPAMKWLDQVREDART